MKTNTGNSNSNSKKQLTAASAKMIEYGNSRKQRIADKYTNACNFELSKAGTANIVNDIATGNKYAAINIAASDAHFVPCGRCLFSQGQRPVLFIIFLYSVSLLQLCAHSLQRPIYLYYTCKQGVQATARSHLLYCQ